MIRRTLIAVCLALSLTAGAAVAPARAHAAAVGVEGTFYDTVTETSGPAGGAFYIDSFSADGRTLVATGLVAISLCFPGVDPKNCVASYDFQVTAVVTDISGSCDATTVEFGAIEGLVGDRFEIDVHAVTPLVGSADNRRLRCSIARQAESGKPLFTFASALNRL